MIKKEQRKKIKQVLGYHYTSEVLELLAAQNITSRSGKPYGKSMIRNVLNGINENEVIENAILALYIKKQEFLEARERRRNEILGLNTA